MAIEITMPKLSDTMTDGQFISWRKNIGERVERGDIIAEVETDKAVMELEAFASGILIKTMAKEGETVPVGTVLGLIGEEGELPPPEAEPVPAPAIEKPAAAAEPVAEPAAAQPTQPQEAGEHEKASPMVRRLAREQGIDLSLVQGSGPEGRITQEDLQLFTAGPALAAPPQEAVPSLPIESATETPAIPAAKPSSAMRQAIAASVSRSWREIPHYTVTMEIAMDACTEVVNELKGSAQPVGYNAIIIKACATALKNFPLLRGATGSSSDEIPVSFAVALDDGLLMPVIRDCQRLSLAEIERESARLAERSRNGKLSSEEMSGGVFSLSNLGMYGVDEFTALILPGQTAILAVGGVLLRPVVRDGQVTAAHTLRVTLSCDHRVIDGAYAAAFLAELRRILERPVALLM